ncbi:MAG: succinate dehydrogenase [Pseudomonadota bacterium]
MFQTLRRDLWWLEPAAVFAGLVAFIIYSTWAVFQNANYTFGPYISPFYAPEIFGASHHALFGPQPTWWPSWLRFSPGLFIVWVPGLFRFTCYYFRGAYYKAFWADPISCAVTEPRKKFLGENSLPLILQNSHRYFMYLAVIFIGFHCYDTFHAFSFVNPSTDAKEFGVGIGTLVLVVDVVLLSCYVFGCHSLRHLIGGVLDIFSKSPARAKAYECSSCLNRLHAFWAWISLVWVGFSDVYIRLCASGVWTDWRIF